MTQADPAINPTNSNHLPPQYAVYQPDPVPDTLYRHWLFGELYPWQEAAWQYLTGQFGRLPHAMLFAGVAGIGKRAFVYRFVAWALCHNKPADAHAPACGHCESCQWLIAQTHPNLYRVPAAAQPISTTPDEPSDTGTAKRRSKNAGAKTSATTPKAKPDQPTDLTIKVDDIRALQPFVQQSSAGMRFVVIHHAEGMTLAAANSLLKTLEEPAAQVLICLLCDQPASLLPTIRSRLQRVAIHHISAEQSLATMRALIAQLPEAHPLKNRQTQELVQLNALSGYAPWQALTMLDSGWYDQRQTWIVSWQALRSHKRSPIQASDYWQKTLPLGDFLAMSQLLLTEIGNQISGLGLQQADLRWERLQPIPTLAAISDLHTIIHDIWQDKRQNVQDKLCYDKLMTALQQY